MNICFNNDFFGYSLSRVNPLECVSMNNQECKVRPEIVNVNSNKPVLKQVNAVIVVTKSTIPMQHCVFLIFLKLQISKYSI